MELQEVICHRVESAKGNAFGQILMIIFSLLYGVISYTFAYYGEMITYLGMTMPMAVLAVIAWIRNPYEGERKEVRVNRIGSRELAGMWCLLCCGFLRVWKMLSMCR